MHELKRALRKELISQRRTMDPSKKAEADERIFSRLLPLLDKASTVFTYVSTEIEVDTRRLMAYCFEHGIKVAVPVSGDTELTFFYITSFEQLEDGRFGILEPNDRSIPAVPDGRSLCIVPALCADGNGFRLGYGRGYYDRFLQDFHGISAILCYGSFIREVPCEPHDTAADITITDITE